MRFSGFDPLYSPHSHTAGIKNKIIPASKLEHYYFSALRTHPSSLQVGINKIFPKHLNIMTYHHDICLPILQQAISPIRLILGINNKFGQAIKMMTNLILFLIFNIFLILIYSLNMVIFNTFKDILRN